MPDSNSSSLQPTDARSPKPRLGYLALAVVAVAVIATWTRTQSTGTESGLVRFGLFDISAGSSVVPVPAQPSFSETSESRNLPTTEVTTVLPPPRVTTTDVLKTDTIKIDAVKEQKDVVRETAARLVGRWEDNFYGHRIFDFAEGGKAEMVIELDSVGALLYGPKLKFFIDWTLEGDVLTLKMTGGEPKNTAKTVSQLFGETSQQRIEVINDTEMKLRSLDSQKLYTHKRLPAAESVEAVTK